MVKIDSQTKRAIAFAVLALDYLQQREINGVIRYEIRQNKKLLGRLMSQNEYSRLQKRERILKLLREQPELSYREIARRCHSTHVTVARLDREVVRNGR